MNDSAFISLVQFNNFRKGQKKLLVSDCGQWLNNDHFSTDFIIVLNFLYKPRPHSHPNKVYWKTFSKTLRKLAKLYGLVLRPLASLKRNGNRSDMSLLLAARIFMSSNTLPELCIRLSFVSAYDFWRVANRQFDFRSMQSFYGRD